MLTTILLVVAAVCFAVAVVAVTIRINLVAAGLLAATLAYLLPRIL